MSQNFPNIQTIFNRGELSTRMLGRVDNKAYYNAYYYGQNMIPYPQGSITKRPGTYFAAQTKATTDTILVPFRFSTVQNYMIELGDTYMRFYRNRGRVETSPGTAYEVTTPWPASVLRQLKFVQSYDTLFVFHPNYQTQKITRTSDTSWTITAMSYVDGPYLPTNATTTTLSLSAATGSVTVTASAVTGINGGTGFVVGDIGRLIRVQNSGTNWGNLLITAFTDTTHVTATVISGTLVVATAKTTWRMSYFGGTQGWPGVGVFYEQRLVVASSPNFPSTIFASSVGFADFAPTDPTTGGVTDSNGFVATIGDDQPNAIVSLVSTRVLLAITRGSEHAITGGTSSAYASLTPSNVTIRRQSRNGATPYVRTAIVNRSILFLSPSQLKLLETAYDYIEDNYEVVDETLFNDHMTQSGIVDMDYQSEPDQNVWCVRADGQLVAFLYNKQQEISGWHRHIIAGTNAKVTAVGCIPRPDLTGDDVWLIVSRTINGSTVQYVEYMKEYFLEANGQKKAFFVDAGLSYDGSKTSTFSITGTTGTVTVTVGTSTFVVGDVGKQVRAGTGKATITGYTSGTQVTATVTTAFDTTSYTSWSVAIKNVSGLSHLEGQTVSVWADGCVVPTATVSSGAFTLADFADYITAGLGYVNYLILLPVEVHQLGTVQGRFRNIYRLHVYLTSSLLLNYGALGINGQLDLIPATQLNVSSYNVMPPLISGLVTLNPPSGYDQTGLLVLQQSSPTPLTINYVVQNVSIGG